MSFIETAYEYFLGHGFTSPQAAGIVGNLIQESNVNPESVQSGGPGRGIAQWSYGGRWQPSLMTGNPQVDLQAQLNFVDQELQSNPAYGLTQLLNATTPQAAAMDFSNYYERPGIIGNRVNDAVSVAQDASTGNWPSATSGSISITDAGANATLASKGGGGSSWWQTALGFVVPGYGGASQAGLTNVGKIADILSTGIAFGAQKQPQKTKGHTFYGSLDELLNPTVTLFSPWGAVTMFLARGGLALLGIIMVLAGGGLLVGATKTGRDVAMTAGKAAVMA